MKLVASMMVASGEENRYLDICLDSLRGFCDEIRAVVDAPCDDPVMKLFKWGDAVLCNPKTSFYKHEGQARQRLLEWTLDADPTHVLAIDCDEFVGDGQQLRERVSRDGNVWTLEMTEIWQAGPNGLKMRVDRQWKPRPVPILWRVPQNTETLRIMDRALACGREPVDIRRYRNPHRLEIPILHFGWANPKERQERYQRYVEHDGGQFHRDAHLQSILDGREHLRPLSWPIGLAEFKSRILQRCR